MADESNDFVLSIGGDDSSFRKTVDALFKEFQSKEIVIPVKASIDKSFKTVLNNVSQNSKSGSLALQNNAGRIATTDFVKALRDAVEGLGVFAMALKGTSSIVRSSAKALSGPDVASPQAKASSPKGQKFLNAMMALPGVAMVGTYAKQGVGALKNFGFGSIDSFNTQQRAETQFRQVLKNSGMGDAEFNDIKSFAGDIQKRTMYGDEAMIAGAGELATYVKSPAQMKQMMTLLADYAAGMTGGQQVNTQQMVDLATGLGKAFDGTFDSLRKKGFDTSRLEELKAIEDNVALAQSGEEVSEKKAKEIAASVKAFNEMGGDIQSEKIKALQEALKDWKGLAEEFSGSNEGKVAQLKNDIVDLREEVGSYLIPFVGQLAADVRERLPEIQKLFMSLAESWKIVATQIFDHMHLLVQLAKVLSAALKLVARFAKELGILVLSFKIINPAMVFFVSQMRKTKTEAIAAGGGVALLGKSLNTLLKGNVFGLVASGLLLVGDGLMTLYDKAKKAELDKEEAFLKQAEQSLETAKMTEQITKNGYSMGKATFEDVVAAGADVEDAEKYVNDIKKKVSSLRKSLGMGEENDVASLKAEIAEFEKNLSNGAKKEIINYQPKITQNNNISTDFDSLGKLIKENLREIAISRLTFKTSSEAAKAMAI